MFKLLKKNPILSLHSLNMYCVYTCVVCGGSVGHCAIVHFCVFPEATTPGTPGEFSRARLQSDVRRRPKNTRRSTGITYEVRMCTSALCHAYN